MFFVLALLMVSSISAQISQKSDQLFENQDPLKINWLFNKVIQLETDDTTYIKTNMSFWNNNKWNDLEVSLRARGILGGPSAIFLLLR